MSDVNSDQPDRRDVLSGVAVGLATLLASSPRAMAQPAGRMADCHVHLFNASDLPVGNFIRYVVIPSMAPGTPDWAAAMADLFANVVKPLAVTVARETNPPFWGLEPSAHEFGLAVARRIRAGSDGLGLVDFDPELEQSYRALSALIVEDSRRIVDPSLFSDPYASKSLPQQRSLDDLIADSYARVAEKAATEDEDTPDLGDLLVLKRLGDNHQTRELLASTLPNLPAMVAGARKAIRMVGWAYLMCLSRERHLRRYLRDYTIPEARPRMIVNNLVDYDRWLDDGPLPSSSHLSQLELLRTISHKHRGRVELLTFAGYCPLKHALELASGTPTTFDALASRYGNEVAGFKLYPPMGFRPWGNRELADDDFARPRQGREVVLAQWRAAGGSPGGLGKALDEALQIFYSWCVINDVPIMAHAGPGNEAALGFGDRANPIHWERARERFPTLRFSLGHLINSAQPFINRITPEVDVGPYDPRLDNIVWSLDAPPRLFATQNGVESRVYGDLGYMPELIGRPELARAFFVALKRHFRDTDPGLRHILFGSDWIMLGIEADDDNYMRDLRRGMIAAEYTVEEQNNVLWENGRRFMKRA
ncbi:hypothetical protein GCM10009116_10040 [Brevundimonas basaltis]|uniref:Putative TIM-barrel fold metal-dependent hydrolase n=1 Tax=Brevundimonas basaltis TaxID=472166 RepID=A0A7W8HY75_9CAUL|nr:amidohydrolase family protein [Brevundimonas basaltis]MBB5292072.1 putative TIM-barrel fold metal-dependent hydrolase [Brevundimonas basaltis]